MIVRDCRADSAIERSGPVAKFFRARFVRKLRSAEPESTQLWVEVRASKSPIHNQKLGHLAFSCSSHTRREKFATGPLELVQPDEIVHGHSELLLTRTPEEDMRRVAAARRRFTRHAKRWVRRIARNLRQAWERW